MIPGSESGPVMLTKRRLWIAGLIVLALAALYFAYDRWIRVPPLPEGLIQVNGRIEGDHVTIASKYPGRVAEILVREGNTVEAGQVLIRLDDAETSARVAQARHGVTALEARLRSARTMLEVLRREVPLSIAEAGYELAAARARLGEARALERQAGRDARRYRLLAKTSDASRQRAEQAETAWAKAQSEVAAGEAALAMAERRLEQARLGVQRIEAKEAELAALRAELGKARAALREVESVLADLTITAPSAGTITTRIADIGEVVAAGAPLYDLVDLDRLYLKAYVPEPEIGKLRLGLAARIFTDAFPERPFAATVRYIAANAEFTPKEVQTPDERVKLVYAVRLYLDENPEHRLTPGMPADAIIRWKEDVQWARPTW